MTKDEIRENPSLTSFTTSQLNVLCNRLDLSLGTMGLP